MDIEKNLPASAEIQRLRVISVLETLSFLVLLAMMLSGNEGGVSVGGATHGFLFLGYAILVLRDRELFGWTWGFAALAIVTGPIGAILVLEKLRRR